MLTRNFNLQGDSAKVDHLLILKPTALLMFAWTNLWCTTHGITPTWTSLVRTVEQNEAVKAKSVTHIQGRGLDLSFRHTWGWNEQLRESFYNEFTEEFKSVGALVERDGKLISRPLVGYKEGHNHFHMQVRP